jgi:hypothetical protein
LQRSVSDTRKSRIARPYESLRIIDINTNNTLTKVPLQAWFGLQEKLLIRRGAL